MSKTEVLLENLKLNEDIKNKIFQIDSEDQDTQFGEIIKISSFMNLLNIY